MNTIVQQNLGNFGQKTGLFLVNYCIGENRLGGVSFNVVLTVNTPLETVQGSGSITQAVNPPLDVTTQLNGSFTYMTVMPNNSKILVTAVGYPPIHMPPHSGVGPVIPSNVQLQMVLDDNWQSGTANYKYRSDITGEWVSVTNAPVIATNINQIGGTQGNTFVGATQSNGANITESLNTPHTLGSFGKEPINAAQTTAIFLQKPGEASGLFVVEAGGDAPNYSYGFSLERESGFVGGIKINVIGCSGPFGAGTTPYKVAGVFQGSYTDKIVLSASNGDFLIDVVRVDDINTAGQVNTISSSCIQAA